MIEVLGCYSFFTKDEEGLEITIGPDLMQEPQPIE